MLYNNHICKLYSQEFAQQQMAYMNGICTGQSVSMYKTLREIFETNPELLRKLSEESFNVLKSSTFDETDYNNHYYQLGVYAVLLSGLLVGYNTDTKKTNLYTSSINLLENLANRGLLVGKSVPIATEMDVHRQSLGVGSVRIAKTLKTTDSFELVRLDHQYKNGKLVFTATRPKHTVTLRNTIFTPYKAVDKAMECFNNWLNDYILEITDMSSGVAKKFCTTKNEVILSSIYGLTRANYLINTAYDSRSLSFNAPVIGASTYTSGFKNIDFTFVDSIRVVTDLNEVDMSNMMLDTTNSRDFIITKAKGMTLQETAKLCELCNIKPKSDKDQMLRELGQVSNDIAFDAITNNNWVAEYKKIPANWGNAVQVEVPATNENLTEMLKTGAYRIWLKTTKGNFTSVIVTNNKSILKRIYGEDYFTKYESTGVKLNALKYTLTKGCAGLTQIPVDLLESKCKEYGLYNEVYSNIYNEHIKQKITEEVKSIDSNIIISEINKAIHNVDMAKTVVKQVNLVTARNCGSHYGDYYKQLSVTGILSIQKVDFLK